MINYVSDNCVRKKNAQPIFGDLMFTIVYGPIKRAHLSSPASSLFGEDGITQGKL